MGYRQFCSRAQSLLLMVFLLPVIGAHAQPFKTQNPGTAPVEVSGKWQFHTGDDLAWADPAYDDSAWEQLRGDETWGAQTHPGHTGFAWYRKRIEVGGADPALAILVPPVDDAYEIYWNGRQIGSYGSLPPHAWWWNIGRGAVYALGTSPANGVLALRVWKSALASTDPDTLGGLNASPVLGSRSVLAQQAMAPRYQQERRSLPRLLIAAVVLVAGLLALLLFLRDRKQWLYLWLAIYLLANGVDGLNNLGAIRYGLHFTSQQFYAQSVVGVRDITLWLLLLALFGFGQERRWRRWTAALAALYLAAQAVDMIGFFFWQHAGAGMQWTDAITTAIYSLIPVYIFFIVGLGLARRRQMTLWPVAIAAFLYGLFSFVTGIVIQGVRFTHWTLIDQINGWVLHLGGYNFGPSFLLNTLLFLVLLFTVARQQLLERRRQAQIESEIKSAREVQHVLIPEEVPAIPGFSIASIYKPAAEVGGDFFQVIQQQDASALIILGDVSGKGLKAAMTVSLIVGTLRTLAEYVHEPAEILHGLNRRLIGRTEGGFATCLVLRVKADGDATLANAGHLAPFRDGKELPVAGSLPLGMTGDAEYEELEFRLQEGETLTLYTDGIPEARNTKGELYGFDRISRLMATQPPVQQIVDAACAFGQEDDITVLSICRVAAGEPHAATVRLTTQIATGLR